MSLFKRNNKKTATPPIQSVSLQRAVDKMENWKIDTLIASTDSSCPCCSRYQGKVFSFYGWDKKYPPLPEMFYVGKCPKCNNVVGVTFKLL